jgi:hypothetical protein
MECRRLLIGAAACLALAAGGRTATAGGITFATGNVETDMPSSAPDVTTIVNHPYPGTQISNPNTVYQPQWMTDAGLINGWVIKDMRVSYDQANDRLYVGVNFFGVAGDPSGQGFLGPATDPRFGGQEHAHLGLFSHSDESITVGLDLTNSGKPTIVAGIAADKSIVGPGTDGFTVNWAKDASAGLSGAYGASLNSHNGNLAFEPSKDHPDFEFSISGVSKIPGFDINNGLGLTAFAGASDDIDIGEDAVPYTHFALEQIPEPATVLAWSLVAAGAAVHGAARRRRHRKGGASRA